MSKEINTGNVTVDQLGEMNLTGNLVPKQWYSTIQTKTNNPKPYHDAINVLAEIVFRYRVEIPFDFGQ